MKAQFIVTHYYGTVEAEAWSDTAPAKWLQERANKTGREIDLYETGDAIGNIALANGIPPGREVGAVKHLQRFTPTVA